VETDNSGIIGYTETRTNINEMKKRYREEYKKIVDKEKKSDSDLFHNKWKVRFGSFGTRLGLTFKTSGTERAISRLGVRAVSFITQKIMELKNKSDKKKYQKQKEELTADFINASGIFKEFSVVNPTTIEEIEETEEKSFHR